MGRSHAEMAEMRALRDPSDPRDGRLQHQIRLAVWGWQGLGSWRPKGTPPEITTKYLLSFTYPREYLSGSIKSWHITNTIKAARMVATPARKTGKGAGSGCGFVWEPIPGALEERSPTGRWKQAAPLGTTDRLNPPG